MFHRATQFVSRNGESISRRCLLDKWQVKLWILNQVTFEVVSKWIENMNYIVRGKDRQWYFKHFIITLYYSVDCNKIIKFTDCNNILKSVKRILIKVLTQVLRNCRYSRIGWTSTLRINRFWDLNLKFSYEIGQIHTDVIEVRNNIDTQWYLIDNIKYKLKSRSRQVIEEKEGCFIAKIVGTSASLAIFQTCNDCNARDRMFLLTNWICIHPDLASGKLENKFATAVVRRSFFPRGARCLPTNYPPVLQLKTNLESRSECLICPWSVDVAEWGWNEITSRESLIIGVSISVANECHFFLAVDRGRSRV